MGAAYAEGYKRERDELVEAVVVERARWEAERAAAEAARAAEAAAWEGERAALTAATEAAAEVDVKGRERAAAALAAVAAEAAWEGERAQLKAGAVYSHNTCYSFRARIQGSNEINHVASYGQPLVVRGALETDGELRRVILVRV